MPVGVSLDLDGVHFGWVRDRSRPLITPFLEAGREVRCTVLERGKRWKKWDNRLNIKREWHEGSGDCVIESADLMGTF